MLDDCENHSASCCEIRLEPSPILTKVSAAGVGTTPGEGPETQRTHCRPGEGASRSEEHTSELQSQSNLVCRLLLEKKNAFTHVTTSLVACATAGARRRRSAVGTVSAIISST